MQKRHFVVGVVVMLASLGSYDLVNMTAASPMIEAVEMAGASMGVTVARSPLALPATRVEIVGLIDAMPDSTVLFAAGVALFGLAAGVRRQRR